MGRKTSNTSVCSTELSFGGQRLEGKPPYRRFLNVHGIATGTLCPRNDVNMRRVTEAMPYEAIRYQIRM